MSISRSQFEEKFKRFGLKVVSGVGPRGRYSIEKEGTLSVLGECNTIEDAITLAEDWLSHPKTHDYEASSDWGDCCRVCGEAEAAHHDD